MTDRTAERATAAPTPTRRDRTIAFIRELSAYAQQVNGAEQQVSQLRGQKEIAEKSGLADPKQLVAMTAQLAQMETQHQALLTPTLAKARRSSFDSVIELIDDINVRLEMAAKLWTELRRRKADLELAMRVGDLGDTASDDPRTNQLPTRHDHELSIESARVRYEAQLDLAYELMPASSSILVLT